MWEGISTIFRTPYTRVIGVLSSVIW